MREIPEYYRLNLLQVMCGEPCVPTATVRLSKPDGTIVSHVAQGTGPVDAIYKAINHLIEIPNNLIEFSVRSVTEGIDAMGEVSAKIQIDDRVYIGRGTSTDIIVASAKSYINAINRYMAASQQIKDSQK